MYGWKYLWGLGWPLQKGAFLVLFSFWFCFHFPFPSLLLSNYSDVCLSCSALGVSPFFVEAGIWGSRVAWKDVLRELDLLGETFLVPIWYIGSANLSLRLKNLKVEMSLILWAPAAMVCSKSVSKFYHPCCQPGFGWELPKDKAKAFLGWFCHMA